MTDQMTTPPAAPEGVTLEEQIALLEHYGKSVIGPNMIEAILANLIRLREIEERLREPTPEMWDSVWEKMCYDEFKRVRQALSIHELRGIFTVFHAALSAILLRGKP